MGINFYKARNSFCSARNLTVSVRLLTILLLLSVSSISAFSQTTSLSFTQISTSTDIVAPGRGAQQWNGSPWDNSNDPYIPASNSTPQEWYSRFLWGTDIETAQGVYTWSVFDSRINAAIDKGQLFSFGIMPMCSGCIPGQVTYPSYLHTMMQAESASSQDWFSNTNNSWIPNWNSPNYLARWKALMTALAAHIASGSHSGKNYRDAIGYVDIRGYGETGEWNTYPWYGSEPAGRKATSASLNAIIDAVGQAFPNNQLVMCFGVLDPGNACLTPPATSAYMLAYTNNFGHIGWRRDNLGDPGFDGAEDGNAGILTQWQVAPTGGEPNNDATDAPYGDLPREITKYHMSYFGNGNWSSVNASNATFAANARQASLNSGYRLTLNGGSTTTNPVLGNAFNITLNWRNIGVAPVYRNFKTQFELRTAAGAVVWTGSSSFRPRLFLPAGSDNVVTDSYILNGFPAGTYNLFLILRDSVGYTMPLPLSINGRNADGSYLLRSNITIGTGGPVDQPPTANAGADQTIQLPTATVSFTGSGTDPDGTIASYAWTKLSGPAGGLIAAPATASTGITGLVQGVYQYILTVTDNQGATGTDTVQVTVNAAAAPADQMPVANAGPDQTIQMPTSAVALTGSATDPDGTISSYAWTKMSGPTGTSMSTPAASSTSVTGLVQGVYKFVLTVTDNLGGKGKDTVQVTVNAAAAPADQAPVANAGSNQTIQLPTSTVSFAGSGTDADGTIASYAWTKLSGPSAGTISAPTTANTNITGLVQGVYQYTLTVTDNQGEKGADTVQVTVNAAAAPADQAPVANAGSNQTIQLPTSTVSFAGSGTDADGTIASYAWAKLSGPSAGTISAPTTANTNITGLVQGVYQYTLTVTDNQGEKGADTVQVTVNAAAAPANQPPVASAGADQTIQLPTSSAILNGSGSSDPDGSIASYLWTKISGPSQFTIGNSGAASTVANNLTAGVYSFQLKVTDNIGATALDTVKITVKPAPVNQIPVSNAGADITITLPTNLANLIGTASNDPDGTITTYLWNQVSGPATASIISPANASTGVSGLQQGVYVFNLKVTDNSGASDNDSVKITVNAAPNLPPVANAGVSKSLTMPVNSTNLDGSLSADPDGSITSFAWAEISGPSTATMTNGNSAVATISNLVAGQYTFELTVTDNSGASSKARVKITEVAAGPQPPIANAGADQTITLPNNSVTIDGSGSNAPSGSIVGYAWTEKSGPSAAGLSNTAQNTLNNLQAGIYIFSLTVTDNNGETGSDSVIITVIPAVNKVPIANPGPSISLTLPTNSTSLNGTASYDPDGTISSYSWTEVSGPGTPASSGANTATLNLSGLVAGQYTYQLTVTDNSGASASAQVKVKVAAAANVLPVADAGTGQTITSPANSVILNGSASYDPDGTIKSYSWVTVSGPGSITISNSNTATPAVSGLQTGQYVFELTVTDNSGATATDQVIITVLPKAVLPNQSPVANAGSNQTITAPQNSIALSGTSSFDPDGTITGYSWTQVSGPSAAVISGGNTSTATVSQLVVGQYVFQLLVTDNNGATATDQVTVNVNPEDPKLHQPPVADAGPSDTISLPTNTFTLDATRSTDPDGTIESYQWQQIGGPNTVTSSSMDNAQVTIGSLQAGSYEFQVTVTDNTGATSTSVMTLTVEPFSTVTRSQLVIYPNPAHDVINGKIISGVTGKVKIHVYDMNGKLVYETQIEKSDDSITKTMDISSLASGMYTIQINIANRKTMVAKFIKD